MKQHEKLEALAMEREADAAAIRRALIVLARDEAAKAGKQIGSKLAVAIGMRKPQMDHMLGRNGNGNGNGGEPRRIGRPSHTTDRILEFFKTHKKATIEELATVSGVTGKAIHSFTARNKKIMKRVAPGVYALRKSVRHVKAAKATNVWTAAARKKLGLAQARRWAEAKKKGINLITGKPLKSATT